MQFDKKMEQLGGQVSQNVKPNRYTSGAVG